MPENKLIRCFYVLSVWLIVFALNTFAGESVGVNMKLVSGEELSGYIDWNPGRGHMSVDTLIKKINAKEFPLRQYVDGGRAYYTFGSSLMFFKQFVRIKYPVQTYVAVSEDKRDIPLNEISRIELNPKLSIKINTSEMGMLYYNVQAKYISRLNQRPVYFVVEDYYGFWKRYFIAISDEATPIDVVRYWTAIQEGIPTFGGMLHVHKRDGFGRLECLGTSKNELMVCDKAKYLWNKLSMDGDEIAKCYSDAKGELSSKKSVKESSGERTRAIEDCYSLEEKVEEKYSKDIADSKILKGFILVVLTSNPTIIDDKK